MSAPGVPERPAPQQQGRLSRMLVRLLMRRATVVAVEQLAEPFRLITLEGPELAGVTWTAGQKIQIAMGSAFMARTYTPIRWDAAAGRTDILAYAHGDGPGSAWVRGVRPGDMCDLFGPRPSLDVRGLSGRLAVFGDETAIGLAHALANEDPARPVACHFEVGDVDGARQVVARLGLGPARLFARRADDAHLEAVEAALPALAAAGTSFVLTGKAGTVQQLRQALKRHAVPSARTAAKAYWAPGKTGLD